MAQESVEEEQRAHLQFVMHVQEHHKLEKAALHKRCRELVGQYKVRATITRPPYTLSVCRSR